jgi:hypothetical protein
MHMFLLIAKVVLVEMLVKWLEVTQSYPGRLSNFYQRLSRLYTIQVDSLPSWMIFFMACRIGKEVNNKTLG